MSSENMIRVQNAFNAMKAIGFGVEKVVPVLTSLLRLYERKWELIEQENYRLLVDAMFENEEAEATKETPRPLKRLRLKYQDGQGSSAHEERPCEIAESCGPPPLNASQNKGKQPSLDLTDNADLAATHIRPAVVTMRDLIEQFDDQTKRLSDSLKKAEERAKRLEEIAKKSMAAEKKALLQLEEERINSNLALKKMEKEKLAVEEQLKNVRELATVFAKKVNSIGSSS